MEEFISLLPEDPLKTINADPCIPYLQQVFYRFFLLSQQPAIHPSRKQMNVGQFGNFGLCHLLMATKRHIPGGKSKENNTAGMKEIFHPPDQFRLIMDMFDHVF